MEGLEASHDLDKDVPNFLLFDVSLSLLITTNLLEDISVVSVLHHKATERRGQSNGLYLPKAAAGLVDEGFLVCYHILVVDACEDAHLVERVLLFFVAEIQHLDFLQGIDVVVFGPSHFVYRGVGSITCN